MFLHPLSYIKLGCLLFVHLAHTIPHFTLKIYIGSLGFSVVGTRKFLRTIVSTKAPVPIVRYDDPSELFSIEYPSSFHLTDRVVPGSYNYAVVVFESGEFSIFEFVSIYAVVGDNEKISSTMTNNLFEEAIAENQTGVANHKLLFNRKTDKGNYTVVELVNDENDYCSYFHNLEEFDNGYFASIQLYARASEPVTSHDYIEAIIESFNWSSEIASEILKLKNALFRMRGAS